MVFDIRWVTHCAEMHPGCYYYALFARGKKSHVLYRFFDVREGDEEGLIEAIVKNREDIALRFSWFLEVEADHTRGGTL